MSATPDHSKLLKFAKNLSEIRKKYDDGKARGTIMEILCNTSKKIDETYYICLNNSCPYFQKSMPLTIFKMTSVEITVCSDCWTRLHDCVNTTASTLQKKKNIMDDLCKEFNVEPKTKSEIPVQPSRTVVIHEVSSKTRRTPSPPLWDVSDTKRPRNTYGPDTEEEEKLTQLYNEKTNLLIETIKEQEQRLTNVMTRQINQIADMINAKTDNWRDLITKFSQPVSSDQLPGGFLPETNAFLQPFPIVLQPHQNNEQKNTYSLPIFPLLSNTTFDNRSPDTPQAEPKKQESDHSRPLSPEIFPEVNEALGLNSAHQYSDGFIQTLGLFNPQA